MSIDPQTLIPNLGGYWFAVLRGELTDPESLGELALDVDLPTGE